MEYMGDGRSQVNHAGGEKRKGYNTASSKGNERYTRTRNHDHNRNEKIRYITVYRNITKAVRGDNTGRTK